MSILPFDMHPDDRTPGVATPGEAHSEWHRNAGVPMGQPGCPQDACHLDDEDEEWEDERTPAEIAEAAGNVILDLYHRTTPEAAFQIRQTGRFMSLHHGANGLEAYFTNRWEGANSTGYGEAVVHIRVPARLAQLDDEFPDGEEHYSVPVAAIRPEHIVPEVPF